MFTQKALIEQASDLLAKPSSTIDVFHFGPDDFRVPDSEETLYLCCGRRTDFQDAVHFWVTAMASEDWIGRENYLLRYVTSAVCRPLTGEQFIKQFADRTFDLKHPLPSKFANLSLPNSAMLMFEDWNDIAVLAEYSDWFLSYHWDTTA